MSEQQATTAPPRCLRGRHVLMVLVGFFATVFLVDAFMIYQAVSTFGGLETHDAYRKGLAYNDRITASARQEQRGWQDDLSYVANGELLRISLSDNDGAPLAGLQLRATIGRPATDRFDRQLAFTQTGPGTYEASVPDMAPGWWTVDLEARAGEVTQVNDVFALRRRLWIKP